MWPWALEVYAKPAVAQACLDLQNSHRQSVPYLLWAAWAAQDGRLLTGSILERGARIALHWEQSAVAPLRRARMGLKSAFDGIADEARESLRAEVKALELRAEAMVMVGLEGIAAEKGPRALPLEPALAAAVAVWAYPAPEIALRRLVDALG